jgi:hypothetical protein
MKAFRIETWGVFLGFALPCMGGFVFVPGRGRECFWSWGYVTECWSPRTIASPRDFLELYYAETV